MRILYLLFSLLFLALQVSPGLSSPRRDMLLCRRGSCHFGRCPSHLIKAGSCFGFRSCCKCTEGKAMGRIKTSRTAHSRALKISSRNLL
ncbi:antimicrobial peptide THP2-like [Cyrtonyx montezumae]|uniref:antimicrobial peptide THP2-like n=1 Tax=Cyrtonyx montezumae TaxID=9017 RepID=UPI0032DA1CF2